MSPASTRYEERLRAPWAVWLLSLLVALIVAASLHGGAGGWRAVVPYVVLLPATVVGLLWVSRGRIRVSEAGLEVPGARIGREHLGRALPLDREGTRAVRGPLADRSAFVSTRGWLHRAVQVELLDPADDTAYWLVGTRHPDRLAAALTGGRGPSS